MKNNKTLAIKIVAAYIYAYNKYGRRHTYEMSYDDVVKSFQAYLESLNKINKNSKTVYYKAADHIINWALAYNPNKLQSRTKGLVFDVIQNNKRIITEDIKGEFNDNLVKQLSLLPYEYALLEKHTNKVDLDEFKYVRKSRRNMSGLYSNEVENIDNISLS